MPSFRATVQVTGMRPGHQPPEVIDAACAAAPGDVVVEARSIELERGLPVIVVRFAVEPLGDAAEAAVAWRAALAIRGGVNSVARPGGLAVTRRVGGHWVAVAPPA